MDKSQWARFAAAVKTLDKSPRKIAEARAEYSEADAYMRDPQNSRNYSENYKERYYQTAQSKRDNAIKAEVSKIKSALETVRELRTFPGEGVDLNSVKLMNAIKIVETMGKKMRPDDQLSIAQQFRGEPGALNFLATLYRQNGLYYSSYLAEMAAPIDNEAINNMQYCVDAYEQLGKWVFDEKCAWTKQAFLEASLRYGFESTNGEDAFITALKAARQGESQDGQRILSEAIYKIQQGGEYLTDAQKAEIFNDATMNVKAQADLAESREIKKQAVTQGLMNTINTIEAAKNSVNGGGNDGA